jgi:alpha-glucosidase
MWWKRAVFYEIYIRSFQDSNGDGIGDLNGIAHRLDYLADLGVDALWITPFYPSPQVDFGYDVSDHENVDPQFGTLADFDRLIAAAHRRGLRVVVDIVLNHTSDRHPWFVESRSSRDSRYRDWYIWRDGRRGGGDGAPPNNWESAFGGPAWTLDPRTDQWFYHFFYAAQPDLNWRNPDVEARMFETLRFWINRGVDGFRLDAVNALFEDPALRDNPALPEPKVTLTGVRTQDFVQTRRLPEVHGVLERVRTFVDALAPDTVLISEAYVDEVADLVTFYGDDDAMHLPFNFFLAQMPALEAQAFRRAIDSVEAALGPGRWPSQVLSNHDIDRACDRLANGHDEHADAIARLLAVVLLTLRGSPFIYYGEEIGMRTEPPSTVDAVRDPVGRVFWPRYKGRDGVRRPMPWTGAAGAGFTSGRPWLALPSDASGRNVEAQSRSDRSLLTFYRAMLRHRRQSTALRAGDYRSVSAHPDVLAFERTAASERMVIAANMSALASRVDLTAACRGATGVVAIGTHRSGETAVRSDDLELAPYEALVLRPA